MELFESGPEPDQIPTAGTFSADRAQRAAAFTFALTPQPAQFPGRPGAPVPALERPLPRRYDYHSSDTFEIRSADALVRSASATTEASEIFGAHRPVEPAAGEVARAPANWRKLSLYYCIVQPSADSLSFPVAGTASLRRLVCRAGSCRVRAGRRPCSVFKSVVDFYRLGNASPDFAPVRLNLPRFLPFSCPGRCRWALPPMVIPARRRRSARSQLSEQRATDPVKPGCNRRPATAPAALDKTPSKLSLRPV